ncbi:uncharacterized protein L969DRAFT_20777 [Mixia osmundae IAM 14324]|uniref:Uncharacterized protein n=1 Tax=Mixia osmundae (strain CBS 9802 / IAM 14324 / JCM 22182 / KY 12970) TaxID=764103 RepID=G7E4M0_MIXOS|nr:uncharacterized protein L969DRAFT_20777 [Mixia osmundae IAM 14324]KEI41840.1 hypothetical protein L969DRAFT_20777 [Mixia osmundae IAM 14324]GAA97780.1 hypothetical protein E5Q_04459 [Mixia osmundae IAM 14324]
MQTVYGWTADLNGLKHPQDHRRRYTRLCDAIRILSPACVLGLLVLAAIFIPSTTSHRNEVAGHDPESTGLTAFFTLLDMLAVKGTLTDKMWLLPPAGVVASMTATLFISVVLIVVSLVLRTRAPAKQRFIGLRALRIASVVSLVLSFVALALITAATVTYTRGSLSVGLAPMEAIQAKVVPTQALNEGANRLLRLLSGQTHLQEAATSLGVVLYVEPETTSPLLGKGPSAPLEQDFEPVRHHDLAIDGLAAEHAILKVPFKMIPDTLKPLLLLWMATVFQILVTAATCWRERLASQPRHGRQLEVHRLLKSTTSVWGELDDENKFKPVPVEYAGAHGKRDAPFTPPLLSQEDQIEYGELGRSYNEATQQFVEHDEEEA